MSRAEALPVERLVVNLPTAADMLCLSESTIEKLVRLGQFPRPVVLSPNRVGYRVRDLRAWVDTRPTEAHVHALAAQARKSSAAAVVAHAIDTARRSARPPRD